MGIEDRDWFREENAKKKGMLYNRKNATYSAGPLYFPRQLKGNSGTPASRRGISQSSPLPKSMHPLLIVLITIAICGGVFVLLKIISQFLR